LKTGNCGFLLFCTIDRVVDTGDKLILVLLKPAANFATGVNDTGGKFAAGVNDTSGNLPPVSTTRWQVMETISGC
jgi:hypothetical protein